jgi:hypothetical protein
MSFAIAKAHPAAMAPIIITRKAPPIRFTPVNLLLKYPNTNRQIRVITAEYFSPSIPLDAKKYGLKGMSPPTT